jgi:hypothetical protein
MIRLRRWSEVERSPENLTAGRNHDLDLSQGYRTAGSSFVPGVGHLMNPEFPALYPGYFGAGSAGSPDRKFPHSKGEYHVGTANVGGEG